MQRQQRALQLSDRGIYGWGIPNGDVSNADRQQAAIKLTENLLGTLIQQQDQEVFVQIVQGVPAKSPSPIRQLDTSFSPVSISDCSLTCRVHSVRFRGKTGLGGGRYVFSDAMTQTAKRGPGHLVSFTTVEFPLSSPITLELHMHWNRFYKTLETPDTGELFVAGVDQVRHLHPTLNGVQQVDKARDQQLAIRAPLYNHMHRQQIADAIAHSRPTIQKVRQASQHQILHELTVHHYSGKDHVGNDILPTALMELLHSAGASAAAAASTRLHQTSTIPPQSQWHHPGPTVQALQQIPILASTVVGSRSPTRQRPSSECGLSTASESSTQSVWTSLDELAEYITNKCRRFKQHLLKVKSHVEDHDMDILELNLKNLDLDKRWSHSGKEARPPSPEEEALSYLRDPEDMDEGILDHNLSQEAVLPPLNTSPTTHAAPKSMIEDASAVLPFPPESEELLQQAVIKALRLHPHSNALTLSYFVWPQHSDIQHDRGRRTAMKVVVNAALYRLPSKVATFRKQRDSQNKLWALAADMPDKP
ncbi:hypothetical protein WJX79_006149 [Trebouxia sp. C0005]